MTRIEALKKLLAMLVARRQRPDDTMIKVGLKCDPYDEEHQNFAEAFGGSLDAAKALHEAVLPDWGWLLKEDGQCDVYPPNDDGRTSWSYLDGYPARAWLIAILKALISIEEAKSAEWKCPINQPDCKENCGNYGCGN